MVDRVIARVASTHPVEKYPGWRLSHEALLLLADKLNSGGVPVLFDHEVGDPIPVSNVDAAVVKTDDGEFAVEASFDVDSEIWASVQSRFKAAGVRGGFSFSATVPQRASSSGLAERAVIAADAAAWSDAERDEAQRILDEVVPTASARLFQYSAVEIATVILHLSESVGLGVLGSAAYDALKALVRTRKAPTRIEIRRDAPDGSSVTAVITTDDPSVVDTALESLPEVQTSPIHYKPPERLWSDY